MAATEPDLSSPSSCLVWDASALHHAARADRLDVLLDLAKPFRHVTTAAVVQELGKHALDNIVSAAKMDVVHVDNLDEVFVLAQWVGRVGATGNHDRGEATVLAWAEVHGAVAVIDDRDARQAAALHSVPTLGTLRLIIDAVRDGRLPNQTAARLVDTLREHGARYPTDGQRLRRWAHSVGLALPPDE
jgi:predicted nucleic acid-binding protein